MSEIFEMENEAYINDIPFDTRKIVNAILVKAYSILAKK